MKELQIFLYPLSHIPCRGSLGHNPGGWNMTRALLLILRPVYGVNKPYFDFLKETREEF